VILGGRKLSSRYHPLQVNAAAFGVGAVLLLVCALSTRLVLSYPVESWLLVLYMGCIPTALAYVMFQAGMRSTPATLTSILTLCEPLTAAVLAWLLFGERLSPLGIVGALLLLGTILLLARGEAVPEIVQVNI
jgi:DME family drug/metabolite transporter